MTQDTPRCRTISVSEDDLVNLTENINWDSLSDFEKLAVLDENDMLPED